MRIVLPCLLCLVTLACGVVNAEHTNNWAVLVSTSRFWFNYRHMANVLSMYRTVRRLGIPDSQIILMLSDDVACNSRNLFPGSVFNNKDHAIDLYGESVEVDYRGYEVTVENFIRLLTDRWTEDQPKSKRLQTDENSNIFIYLTGHGGDDFLKFQDAEEIASEDIADAFAQMYEKKRYNEIFFMIDTCQANTMYSKFYSPNVLAVGSSELDESSYSHHSDVEIGVAVIDRFTYYSLEFLEQIDKTSNLTLKDLFDSYTFEKVHSHVGVRSDLFKRNVSDVLITDFFANVQNVIPDDNSGKTSGNNEDIIDLAIQKSQLASKKDKSSQTPKPKEPASSIYFRTASSLNKNITDAKNNSNEGLMTILLIILVMLGLYTTFKRTPKKETAKFSL
ncbi:uncharacterized protein HLK63_M01199 [Nakaseomyces glabratus]|nr:uncharacterized protein GW608_M01199 [Nakaseomyces glabratus]UCS28626.1 uncharacterized protein HLK63_M01199 [Nakaseomyces glabratus]UCS33855.1 uncharacterized protein HLK64_M01199 [Nakaseomyces glabratus]UCS39085.1 uncharacterized protein HLK62_M01199 [Nakaseomyces glabratus]